MRTASEPTELRIVDQARSIAGRDYYFRYRNARMRVHVAPVAVDGVDAWRVDASVRAFPEGEATTVHDTGLTRTDALRSLARSSLSGESSHMMGLFDWEAVEKLLVQVKAL